MISYTKCRDIRDVRKLYQNFIFNKVTFVVAVTGTSLHENFFPDRYIDKQMKIL